MTILSQKQLSLAEIYSDCTHFFESDKHHFLSLLEENLNLHALIPHSFYQHYYRAHGRHRDFDLCSILWALILQRIFSIPTDTLLITFLKFSRELRDFCGFNRVPHASQLTRFKKTYLLDLQSLFHRLVDVTEPICQKIDADKAMMTIFDTSGIEAYVTENNPKFANKIIKQLKAFKKSHQLDDAYDPYKAAYSSMPTHAKSNPEIKQLYINGHFCYADKFTIITNGLGLVRHIAFLDDDFKQKHPEIEIDKKSDSPDEDKSIGDSSALKPVLQDFFELHPDFHPSVFLGDSAFDSIDTYTFLKDEFNFEKAIIPYNPRNESTLKKVGYNEYGYPLCPNNSSLVMKYCGLCREKGRADRIKWTCPKVHVEKGQYVCDCDNPCSTAKRGRTTYTYENMSFRMFPGLQRDSDEWNELYKTRTVVERAINHFKMNMCIAGRKSRDHLTTKADVLIAGIASQFTAIIAHRLSYPQYLRSLKPLIA